MSEADRPVLIRRLGAAGRITLNRPRAFNALSAEMVTMIADALAEFEASPSVDLIVIDSASPRAFSAGGDILPVWQSVRSGDFAGARAICRAEYDLDLAIAQAAKPVISLIDGLVMGGGIGLSCHVSHPVLTERARLTLPETGIGFVPDSGINAILASGPGRLGARLALTGETIGAGDMLRAGFGRHMVRSTCLPALLDALAGSGDPAALGAFAAPPPPALLAEQQAETDAAFAGADLTGILARLDRRAQGSWQKQAARLIRRNSPAACQTALDLLAAIGPEDPLETVLATEFDAVSAMLAHPDFIEGVRAHIVDRDRKPLWRVPETIIDRNI